MKKKTVFDILVEEVINNPSDWNNKVKLKQYKIDKKDSKQQKITKIYRYMNHYGQ
tara:strand:- start:733 stop:897 length:165 start_codon:yes stop_codon:yes gene_type:complete